MTDGEIERLRRRERDLEDEVARLRAQLLSRGPERPAEQVRPRDILQSSIEFAIIATDRGGLVTEWNAGAERLLGWPASAMIGHAVDRIFTDEDREAGRVEAEMRLALTEGRARDDRWHLRQDGSRFWASGEMMTLRDPSGTQLGFIKVLHDRTADHQAIEDLRETEAALRHAQEAGGVGVFWVRVDDDMLHPTPAFCRLYGLPERKIYPAEAFERLVIAEDEALVSHAASRRSGQAMRDVEYRIRRPDTGAIRWIARTGEIERDPEGHPVRFVGVARDITEAKLAREALRTEREQLAQLFEQAPSFMAMLRGPEHLIERVNPGYTRLVGGRDVTGKTIAEALPDAVEQGYLALLDEVFRSGEAYAAAGQKYVMQAAPDDPAVERYIDFVFQPIRDPAGDVSGIFVEGSDVTARTQAAAALRLTENRYQALFTSLDAGFCVVEVLFDAEQRVADYRFVEANPAFATHTGLVDVVGRTMREIDAGHEQHWFDLFGQVATTGKALRCERSIDALGRWVDVHAFRMSEAEPRHVAVLFNDITQRKRAEDELRAFNATLEQRVLDRTRERDRIWQVSHDLLGVADETGAWISVNPAWTRTLGWPNDAFLGRTSTWLLHPDDRDRAQAKRERLAAGHHVIFEGRYRTASGAYRLLKWTAVHYERQTYSVARDVTDERKREAELKDWVEFARLALSAVEGVGVWTYDVALDTFFCDAAVSALYGIDPVAGASGIPRSGFLANVHPDDMPRLAAVMAAGINKSGDLELEYRIRHPDGTTRWVLSRGHTHFSDAGRAVRRTGVGVETTRRRQLEEQLRQSQKMEAVGQLTGGIAHDFNNLLTGISGSLELLTTRIAQGRFGDVERYTTAAQGAAKRAAALTHRLLAFSRRQTLDPKPTDVNRLVSDMEELVCRSVGPAVEIATVAAEGLWPTLVDPSQLENALLNLCINARDAMPDGGRITIETANRPLAADDARALDLQPGEYIVLKVGDTGTGMAPDVIAKAFEPFFTTKPLGLGTGLGLSMIYGFARQSGGHVRIVSEVGRGTIVSLYLPRHRGEADTIETAARLVDAPRAGAGETVLVVDDEPSVRMLVTEVLEDLGYAAIEAADGSSGLRVLQSDTRIDLLVTDVGLPGGMNGRQMVDAARVGRPQLKVLFITGYAEAAVIGDGQLEAGMHVVTKPFAMETLAARIKELIRG